MNKTIDHHLVELALGKVGNMRFEQFSLVFFSSLLGIDFVPLGGMHDGGAEGFVDTSIFEDSTTRKFVQVSTQETHRQKIRNTVKRLIEFGRKPKLLLYITNRIIPHIDKEQELLSDELELRVSIRDLKYIATHINDSSQTIQAFNTYLSAELNFLRSIGGSSIIGSSTNGLPARTLCVFLGQEVNRRCGNSSLLNTVTDTLILWSLEGTNPDKMIFLNKEEILEKIEDTLPSAKDFIRGNIDFRLKELTNKHNTDDRKINHHTKENNYCLPFETRQIVEQENIEDVVLKLTVSEQFGEKISQMIEDPNETSILEKVVNTCHRTLEITFEKQGLEMAYFVMGDEPEDYVSPSISSNIDIAIEDLNYFGEEEIRIKEISLNILRDTFYHSSSQEREYLEKLSRTYTLMFLLKNDAKIVEYFQNMTSDFVLYVGADLFIRALSEHYLSSDDKMTFNMFKILNAGGSKLILTDKTLDEIWSHLKVTDLMFKNEISPMEPHVTLDIARHIDRILIRSYFYARLGEGNMGKKPNGWRSYLGQFCEYRKLHSNLGRESLKEYLCTLFDLDFESTETLEADIDNRELDALTDKIKSVKFFNNHSDPKNELLARNDALQVLRIYQKRKESGETKRRGPYGYHTWWLTNESAVRKATGYLVEKHSSFYMMRPEFLLNFISLAPNSKAVKESFANVFPTLLGVKLSNRMDPKIFKSVMKDCKEAFGVDDARVKVKMAEFSDRLKGSFFKKYENRFNDI